MGLLEHSLALEKKSLQSFDFFSFATKKNLQKSALFVPIGDVYCIGQFYGLNAETALNSVAPKSFWQNMLPDTNWHFCSGKQLDPYRQLFSKADSQEMTQLLLKRIPLRNGTDALFVGQQPKSVAASLESVFAGITSLTTSLPSFAKPDTVNSQKIANLFAVHFLPAIRAVIAQAPSHEKAVLQSLSSTIYNAAFFSLKSFFAAPSICAPDSNMRAKVALLSAREISINLFAFQLQSLLTGFFPKEAASAIAVWAMGAASPRESIASFFQPTSLT